MKIQSCSLTADSLKGAIVSYADGTEMGAIVDISFNLDSHVVVVMIRQKDCGITGIPWEAMKNWRISLQSEIWTNNIYTYVDEMSDAVEDILERRCEPS